MEQSRLVYSNTAQYSTVQHDLTHARNKLEENRAKQRNQTSARHDMHTTDQRNSTIERSNTLQHSKYHHNLTQQVSRRIIEQINAVQQGKTQRSITDAHYRSVETAL